MHSKNRSFSALAFGIVALAVANYESRAASASKTVAATVDPPRYIVIDLGSNVDPVRIANSGHVLYYSPGPNYSAGTYSRWSPSGITPITADPNSATDMNNLGVVVGSKGVNDSDNVKAFRWSLEGTLEELESPWEEIRLSADPPGPMPKQLILSAINDAGNAYGTYRYQWNSEAFGLHANRGIKLPATHLDDLELVSQNYINSAGNERTKYAWYGKEFSPLRVNNKGTAVGALIAGSPQPLGDWANEDFIQEFAYNDVIRSDSGEFTPIGFRPFDINDDNLVVGLNEEGAVFSGEPGNLAGEPSWATGISSGATLQIVGNGDIGTPYIWERDQPESRLATKDPNKLLYSNLRSTWQITEMKDINDRGVIAAVADKYSVDSQGNRVGNGTSHGAVLLPVEMTLHRRGTINIPGAAIPRPTDLSELYEVVTLENADFDEQTNWAPNSMTSASETNRQDALNHANQAVNRGLDDDLVKMHLQAPIPPMAGTIELIMDQAGQGDRMGTDDLRFYNTQGQSIPFDQLRIADLQNPQGALAPMLQPNGLDLFVEIADLGQLTRAQTDASRNQRRYADLILRLTLGDKVTELRGRIYRGGYWRNQRSGNAGTIAFYDGKGRYQDKNGAWKIDVGLLVHGPYSIFSGTGTTDATVQGRGPTPPGWYGLYERTDFRTTWDGRARPQTDHTNGPNRQPLGYLQQGSYCQWSSPGNRDTYTHQGANPPASIRFKFELVPWGHNAHGRTVLQIHPDGLNDGTAGCVGLQTYNDCCRIFFLLRHYFGTRLNVETP